MRRIDKIIVHCSATPEGKDYGVADIDEWHRARGFRGIGYHYVVYRDGSVHRGRAVSEAGDHCVGQNAHSIGVCYIGGCDESGKKPKDTRTPAQRIALTALVKDLLRQYPGSTVHGHNEFSAKACPSFNVKTWLTQVGIKQ